MEITDAKCPIFDGKQTKIATLHFSHNRVPRRKRRLNSAVGTFTSFVELIVDGMELNYVTSMLFCRSLTVTELTLTLGKATD